MMQLNDQFEGIEIDLGAAVAVLGNRNSSSEEVFPKHKNQAHLAKIHQKHTDLLVKAQIGGPLEIADAHWSQEKGLALRILTADCAPLLLYCPRRQTVAAIHAGWRGIENQITIKTLNYLLKAELITKDVRVIIGPHIQWHSFEIEMKLAYQLTDTVPWIQRELFLKPSGDKFLVDLHQILKEQILRLTERPENIWALFVDTKTNQQYHSYRRDGTSSGRQNSYIYLKAR
ncbi:MAG: polyphenol oxidase family protein [Proteobacteria bacterium]|jgi:hypothetical protein|nr:polyphenol oxidase family protein [Pseudomonadota bacterium]